MNIKVFVKSLTESEHNDLLNYASNHHKFSSIILDKAKRYNDMLVEEWLDQQDQRFMNPRLINGLKSTFRDPRIGLNHITISQVTIDHFKMGRNLGQKSWEEFVELRGY